MGIFGHNLIDHQLKIEGGIRTITFQLALLLSLALTALNFVSCVASGTYTPLWGGFLTGLILGHPAVGLTVGAACTLMSAGFYSYGGTVIPDYTIGAMFGVVVAIQSGAYGQGLVIGTAVALLDTWFTILAFMAGTFFLHRGEKSLANNNLKGFERWHLNGIWTQNIAQFVPVFIGLLLINNYKVISDFVANYTWVEQGLNVIGEMLPAVGFGLLLSYMDIKKYWPFLLIGFVLYAYLKVQTMGLAILGVALAYIFAFMLKKSKEDGEESRDSKQSMLTSKEG